jgi:hypothetical protein
LPIRLTCEGRYPGSIPGERNGRLGAFLFLEAISRRETAAPLQEIRGEFVPRLAARRRQMPLNTLEFVTLRAIEAKSGQPSGQHWGKCTLKCTVKTTIDSAYILGETFGTLAFGWAWGYAVRMRGVSSGQRPSVSRTMFIFCIALILSSRAKAAPARESPTFSIASAVLSVRMGKILGCDLARCRYLLKIEKVLKDTPSAVFRSSVS